MDSLGLHYAAQGLHFAAQGLHYTAQGLYYAAQGLYYAAQGLYYAAQGLYSAAQGPYMGLMQYMLHMQLLAGARLDPGFERTCPREGNRAVPGPSVTKVTRH